MGYRAPRKEAMMMRQRVLGIVCAAAAGLLLIFGLQYLYLSLACFPGGC